MLGHNFNCSYIATHTPSFRRSPLRIQRLLLQNLAHRRRHNSAFLRLILRLEIIAHLLHGDPLDALVAVDVVDDALVHEQDVWATRNVRVDGHGEDKLVVVGIEVVEVVLPDVLDVARVRPAAGEGGVLDEHHGRQVWGMLA